MLRGQHPIYSFREPPEDRAKTNMPIQKTKAKKMSNARNIQPVAGAFDLPFFKGSLTR
jgi:hypothetical protein